MKKMLLQMTAAQLLMQTILTLYCLIVHRLQGEEPPEFAFVLMLILAGLPSVLFCMAEPGLRVQNYCRKRWRHVTACLFLWGLECAAFCGIAYPLTATGMFSAEAAADNRLYAVLPFLSLIEAAAWAAVWFGSGWLREKRIARLYGRQEDSGG